MVKNNPQNHWMIQERKRLRWRLVAGAIVAIALSCLGYGASKIIKVIIADHEREAEFRRSDEKASRIIAEGANIRAEWEKDFGTLEEFPKRFPPRQMNETAVQSKILFKELELDRSDEQLTLIDSYLKKELSGPTAMISAPPKKLQDYFKRKRDEIITYRQWLIQKPIPQWDFDIQKGRNAPFPDSSQNYQAPKLFVAGALMELRSGHDEEAFIYLEALWKLCQGLEDYPELASQGNYITAMGYLVGTLRKTAAAPVKWKERLAVFDRRDAIHAAMGIDIFQESVSLKLTAGSENKFSVASLLNRQKQSIQLSAKFKEYDGCQSEPDENTVPAKITLNLDELDSSRFEFYDSYGRRSGRLRLDSEMTLKLFQAQAARLAAADKRWSALIPGVDSTICKNQRWNYQVTPDRKTMTIRYSANPSWPRWMEPKLPLSFSETMP